MSCAGLWERGMDQVELRGSFNLQKLSWDAAARSKLKLWELLVSLELFWLSVVQT